MTIIYADGKGVEAVLLSRTENTMRDAVEGAEEAMELSNVGGIWVSDECEPVSIQFALAASRQAGAFLKRLPPLARIGGPADSFAFRGRRRRDD